jgi:hypothetical protein
MSPVTPGVTRRSPGISLRTLRRLGADPRLNGSTKTAEQERHDASLAGVDDTTMNDRAVPFDQEAQHQGDLSFLGQPVSGRFGHSHSIAV